MLFFILANVDQACQSMMHILYFLHCVLQHFIKGNVNKGISQQPTLENHFLIRTVVESMVSLYFQDPSQHAQGHTNEFVLHFE